MNILKGIYRFFMMTPVLYSNEAGCKQLFTAAQTAKLHLIDL
jgi:hypothetical protein